MNRFLEKLETRELFSATTATIFAGLLQVSRDAMQVQKDLRGTLPALHADLKTVKADLKQLPLSKNNIQLLTRLHTDQVKCFAKLSGDYAKLMRVSTVAMNKVMMDAFKVMAKPNDEAAKAKLTADIVAAQTAAAAPTEKFMTDLNACATTLNADVAALVAANPTATKLATDLQTMQAHGVVIGTNIQSHFATAQTDLGKLFADLLA